MIEVIGIIFIVMGIVFDFLGCLGLVRFPDVYNRLQASTKCVTFGTASILFGTYVMVGFNPTGIKCILALIFVLLTSPTASHALARASYKGGIKLWEKSKCDFYSDKNKI
ncbi:MAG: monovalent cation/H(+) antiporter subunit G [Candidatus Omnitrophica bacterium]|nr:monovalent cation/H(+) antiporter subunit G [Candidatus Omnitrophota bacterium]